MFYADSLHASLSKTAPIYCGARIVITTGSTHLPPAVFAIYTTATKYIIFVTLKL